MQYESGPRAREGYEVGGGCETTVAKRRRDTTIVDVVGDDARARTCAWLEMSRAMRSR